MSRGTLLAVVVTAVLTSSLTAVVTQTITPSPAGATATPAPVKHKPLSTDERIRRIYDDVFDGDHGLHALRSKIDSISSAVTPIQTINRTVSTVAANVSGVYDALRMSGQVVRIYQCVVQHINC